MICARTRLRAPGGEPSVSGVRRLAGGGRAARAVERSDRRRRGHRPTAREAPVRRGAGGGCDRGQGHVRAAGRAVRASTTGRIWRWRWAPTAVHVGQEDMPVGEVRELVGRRHAGRALHPRAGGDRRGGPRAGGLHRRGPGARHADQARPRGGGCGAPPLRGRPCSRCRSSRSAAWTWATWPRLWMRARAVCACCGRSPTRRIPSARRGQLREQLDTRTGAVSMSRRRRPAGRSGG